MKRKKNHPADDAVSSAGHKRKQKKPVYTVGLMDDQNDEGVWNEVPQVVKPSDLPLSSCYQWIDKKDGCDLADRANAHLLAATGKLEKPFVPVRIPAECRSHSWADIPVIEKIQVEVGNTFHASDRVWIGELICVESLTISVTTSDGKVFRSPVPIAVKPGQKDSYKYGYYDVYVTPEAAQKVSSGHILSLLGGNYDPPEASNIYDVQCEEFDSDLRRFWLDTSGPDEYFRQSLMDLIATHQKQWESITIKPDGRVSIKLSDGKIKKIQRPKNFPFPKPLNHRVSRIMSGGEVE